MQIRKKEKKSVMDFGFIPSFGGLDFGGGILKWQEEKQEHKQKKQEQKKIRPLAWEDFKPGKYMRVTWKHGSELCMCAGRLADNCISLLSMDGLRAACWRVCRNDLRPGTNTLRGGLVVARVYRTDEVRKARAEANRETYNRIYAENPKEKLWTSEKQRKKLEKEWELWLEGAGE